MTEYRLEVEGHVHDSVKCCLCNQLLVNPYISPCGCQSCENCIKEYLRNNYNVCPGTKEECKEEILEMDKNVVKDYRAMQDIIKTVVKCPNESCLVKTELENMEAHIRGCKKRPITCPFKGMGCESEGITEVNVNDHLHLSVMEHSELLVESNIHLKNEIDILRQDLKETYKEINELKEILESNNKEMKEVCNLIKKVIAEKEANKIELYLQKREITECQEEQQKLFTLFNTLQKEFFVKEHLSKNNSENKSDEVSKKTQLLENIDYVYKAFMDSFKTEKYVNLKTSFTGKIFKREQENNENTIQMKQLEAYDFEWRIERFSEIQKGSYDSHVFYKGDLKFCLRLIIGRYDLCLYLCLMNDEAKNMEKLYFENFVNIYFINQNTMTAYTNDKYKCDNCREAKSRLYEPKQMNEIMVGGKWMIMSDLKTTPGLLVNDSLLICCSLLQTKY